MNGASHPRQWALVTGASSGIGMALARELAQRGYDLILLGRDAGSLAQLAQELDRAHHTTAKVFAQDLSTPATVLAIRAMLERENLSVSVVVNNAGYGIHGRFAETDLDRELALIHLQIHAMLILTKACLTGMLRRREGKILNVASVYAYSPVPLQSVYAACKAFLLSFSESLAAELYGTGVTVTVLCPGMTATAFRTRAGMRDKASWMSMDARTVASIACRGLFQKRPVVVPGVINRLYVWVSKLVPRRWIARMTAHVNRRRGLGAAS
jgi:short-subunit dehydrogenase